MRVVAGLILERRREGEREGGEGGWRGEEDVRRLGGSLGRREWMRFAFSLREGGCIWRVAWKNRVRMWVPKYGFYIWL